MSFHVVGTTAAFPVSKAVVRKLLVVTLLLLSCGCTRRLVLNNHSTESRNDWLRQADLIFVGVIQKHQFDTWPYIRLTIPPKDNFGAPKQWNVLRREVRVETVIRGRETRKVIDVYEVVWTGGAMGDWNSTQNGERDLFLVRIEDGMYHVVQDWWRSIFTVTTGPHKQLPLDDSHPLWERIALMNWWIPGDPSARITYPQFRLSDPGGVLEPWRRMKLLRGLVRHPSSNVRLTACRELLEMGSWGQDECWEMLSESEREHLHDGGHRCCSAADVATWRLQEASHNAEWYWLQWPFKDRESRRLFTAINNPVLRSEFCRLWQRDYPDDHDTGGPANQPPPATIVTARGDVPLTGPWPR